jgi:hypothetical protein
MLDDLLRRNGMQLEPLDSDSDAEADLALPPEAVELPSKVPTLSLHCMQFFVICSKVITIN